MYSKMHKMEESIEGYVKVHLGIDYLKTILLISNAILLICNCCGCC